MCAGAWVNYSCSVTSDLFLLFWIQESLYCLLLVDLHFYFGNKMFIKELVFFNARHSMVFSIVMSQWNKCSCFSWKSVYFTSNSVIIIITLYTSIFTIFCGYKFLFYHCHIKIVRATVSDVYYFISRTMVSFQW